jgi:hypothetical protein
MILLPHEDMTNQEIAAAAKAQRDAIEACLDELYALPRTFRVRAAIDQLAEMHATISREAALALLSSAETAAAAKTLNEIAEDAGETAAHMVILTGYLTKANAILGQAHKVIEAAKNAAG